MNVSSILIKDYDDFVALRLSKNKAKQSQFVFANAAAFLLTLTTEPDYNEIVS